MSERERPPYLPAIPPPSWPALPDHVPSSIAAAAPAAEAAAVDVPQLPVAGDRAEQPVIPQEGVQAAAVPHPEAPDRPEQRRVVLAGRVGRAPVFGRTPAGTLKATFPLAIHPTPATTEWKRVVAFAKRAEALRGTLVKGQEVAVIGYARVRQVRGKTGQLKPVEEVYATVVRTPRQDTDTP